MIEDKNRHTNYRNYSISTIRYSTFQKNHMLENWFFNRFSVACKSLKHLKMILDYAIYYCIAQYPISHKNHNTKNPFFGCAHRTHTSTVDTFEIHCLA